jgi:fumarate reductase (CoM/CoB) subunit A
MSDTEFTEVFTDVAVIGSEGAGARAAIDAHKGDARVAMISKGLFGRSGVTLMAPFSCCVAFGHEDPRDNPYEHYKDTIIGGHYLSNPKLVKVFAEMGPQKILDLESYGARFEKRGDKFHQVIMPGHSYPRAVYYDFSTGQEFRRGLRKAVGKTDIQLFEDTMALDIIKSDGQVAGVLCYDLRKGDYLVIRCKAVIIATGGNMEMFYPHSDASNDVTGDGLAMALRAGATLENMEFSQFLPAGLIWPPGLIGMIWTMDLRYHLGAWLLNNEGQRFMAHYDRERMELSTRDMVSRGSVLEILEGRGSVHGGVYMSVKHIPENIIEAFIQDRFPDYSFRGYSLLDYGVDIKKDALEISPVAHFFMGGIKIDENCYTGVPGLLAAAETCSGVNGANRIEGNALTETQVFGSIAGENAARDTQKMKTHPDISNKDIAQYIKEYKKIFEHKVGEDSYCALRKEVQKTMWESVGVVRRGDRLDSAVTEFSQMRKNLLERAYIRDGSKTFNREFLEAMETRNMILQGEAMALSALERTESRGAHYRLDYPEENNNEWLINISIKLENEDLVTQKTPVDLDINIRPQ